MKYFSEKLNKQFDTEKECLEAEAKYDEEQKKTEVAVSERKAEVSRRKKELSDQITVADKDIDSAYKELDAAKEEANKIVAEAKKRANEIVRKAVEKVDSAASTRRDLVEKFNDEFGPYMVTYTGSRADEEYNRLIRKIKNAFSFDPFRISDWLFSL